MTLGLFIGRLNPPHIGHLRIIDKALEENEKVLLLVGTSGINDLNNPLTFEEIKGILNEKYSKENRLMIMEIRDTLSDKEWVKNIGEIILEYGDGIKSINFYGGDFKNDSAYKVIKEYQNGLGGYTLTYVEIPRDNSFIEHNGKNYAICSTNLRQALRKGNLELAEKFMDKNMSKKIKSYF